MNLRRILQQLALLVALPAFCAAGEVATAPVQAGEGWPEFWGNLALKGYGSGERVAPNGVVFDPVFRLDFNLNVGLLPRKQLYLFVEKEFWAQRAAPGITNRNQGSADFSKREFDLKLGLAWNVLDRFELWTSFSGLNSLNRGPSRVTPTGEQSAAEFEARYYLPSENIYDLGRLSFVSVGYRAGDDLVDADGREFNPGLFARAYLTVGLP